MANIRLLYLYNNILKQSGNGMIRKVYEKQKMNTNQGDFAELVAKDKKNLDLPLSDREIVSIINKAKFKTILKTKTRQAAFKFILKSNVTLK